MFKMSAGLKLTSHSTDFWDFNFFKMGITLLDIALMDIVMYCKFGNIRVNLIFANYSLSRDFKVLAN